MNRRELFLERLAQEAGKSSTSDGVEALVVEAKAHLDDDIRARLELGASPEEAEREAIRAFGNVEDVGKEYRRLEPKIDRPFAFSALALLGLIAWAGGSRSFPGWTYLAMIAFAWLLHAAFLVSSACARRPQWRTFALLLVPLWWGTAALKATQEVSIFGAPSVVEGALPYPRTNVLRATEAIERQSQHEWEIPSQLVEGYARYVRRESDLVPGASLYGSDGRLRFHRETDRTKGEKAWRQAVVGGIRLSTARVMSDNVLAEALERQGDRSWWAELPYQLAPAADQLSLLSIVGVYGGSHLLFWSLGVALRRRRARRGPNALA